ncbi:MAG: GAF domain-containing protein [Verrucomicrobiota bacterium]
MKSRPTSLACSSQESLAAGPEGDVSQGSEARYLGQRNALITLTQITPADNFEILNALRQITETTATTMELARVGIWRYSPDRQAIECLDLYQLESGVHTSGQKLAAADYPAYFNGLAELEVIVADDARSEPRTCELSANYLTPHPVVSMMVVPIHFHSAVDYILCNEHLGALRHWTEDEKTFSAAIGNLVSVALESAERARTQQEMLKSHQRFHSVAAATNDTIWDWDLQTDAFWWNDGFAKLFGWASSETEATIQAWIRQIHPEDRNRVVEGIYASIHRGDAQWSDEYRFISNDGAVAHVQDRGQIIRDSTGKAIRMVGGMTDTTAHKVAELALGRSHRALQMLSSCNEMLIRTSAENELLNEACRIAVEIGGYRMAWVGYAMEDDQQRIRPMAHAGEELGYLSEIQTSWADDHPSAVGPAGQAVRSGHAVVFEDIIGNPEFSNWLAPARARGYRSVVCLPLRDHRRAFGVLCFYAAEPHPANADEIKLLQEMANDLAFGIENIRGREERQRTQEVVIKVAQAVSRGTGSEFFDLLTRNMVEALGAHGGIIGRFNSPDNSIDTLSYCLDGKPMDNVSYSLVGTPCEKVINGDVCVFAQGVQQLFPDDHLLVVLGIEAYAGIPLLRQDGGVAGIMVVLFSSALKETELVRSTLQIFAARAAAELDRQQSDARIREQASLLDKAQDAILVRGLDHSITYWNKSAERLYGWSADEAVGRSVDDLLYRDPTAFSKAHARTLELGEWVGEINQIDKFGRDLTIEGHWTLVRDELGRPASVFAINTDITEHRKLEQQFLRAQRLESIGTLAGGIAHDLNNILAPISMAVELLKMRVTDGRSTELLDTIANSAKRGADMVGQVLSFARGMEGHRVEIHPRQLILEIEGILRDTFSKSIQMEVVAGRDLWTIHGDPTQLHQVLLNLCVNARDAISGPGKILITADNVEIDASFAAMNLEAKEGPHLCIEVEDTGDGISPEIFDKIFDPFFTTKSVGKGTGLGLSTTLAIVKSHGGFIRTFSEPGVGTRFRVYLPAHPEVVGALSSREKTDLPHGNGETVLVVDDEASIRQITRQTLESFGYHTLLAADGHQAVALYTIYQSAIDVVLTDMMMPVMDGPATIRKLMEIDPTVRIIATSGISANRDLAILSGNGVKNFLPKPYTAETLLTCLKQVLAE